LEPYIAQESGFSSSNFFSKKLKNLKFFKNAQKAQIFQKSSNYSKKLKFFKRAEIFQKSVKCSNFSKKLKNFKKLNPKKLKKAKKAKKNKKSPVFQT
jgi:hypothetical protein